jgi:mannose-6-phosphate isomerase-like protein (cupin superfamily)
MQEALAHVLPGEGRRSLWVMGEFVTLKVPSRRTGEAYSLFEVVSQPETGPPLHVQHREDESFYVLEGDYEFLLEDHTLRPEAGSLIYVPKGVLHAHRNVGEGTGKMLLNQTPGGLYELFFEKAGKPANGEADPAGIEAIAAEYGIEILPPPTPRRLDQETR